MRFSFIFFAVLDFTVAADSSHLRTTGDFTHSGSPVPGLPAARQCYVGNISHGFNLAGNDMHQIARTLTNASACGEACCATEGCTAFTFAKAPARFHPCHKGDFCCYLKNGEPTLHPGNATALASAFVRHFPPTIKILPLGDSITFGCGDSMSPACVAEGKGVRCTARESPCASCAYGYRVRLFQTLNDTHPNAFEFVGTQHTGPADCGALGVCRHEGHPGWRTTDLSAIVDNTLAPLRPDIILLHIGTNDIGRNNYPSPAVAAAEVSRNLRSLVTQLLAAVPGAHVFLASILAMPTHCHFYRNPNNLTAQEEAYNSEIPGVAQGLGDRVTFVDMRAETGLCDMERGQGSGCCPPQLHPDGAGYTKMAAVWAKALRNHYSS